MLRRFLSTKVDVCIVGGGPAGLSLMALLKRSPATAGLRCVLVEAGDLAPARTFAELPPSAFSNRVSSLTPASIGHLDRVGAWDHINQDRIQWYDHIVAYDGVSGARVEFDKSDAGAMCENLNLQSGLLAAVAPCEGATVVDKTKVVSIAANDECPEVTLDNGDSYHARLLVGADGFNLPVRHYAGIVSRGWGYDRFGVVASLRLVQPDLRRVAFQRFLPTGPIAMLPLPDNNATLVWSTTPELSQVLTKVLGEAFVQLVNAAFVCDQADMEYFYQLAQQEGTEQELAEEIAWRLSVKDVDPASSPAAVAHVEPGTRQRFPLKLSHADTYVAPRVALVGDAAHTTHPLAGQGLNMGQGDVELLARCLATATLRGLDIGSPLALEPYWAERFPKNHLLLGVVDKLHKVYSTDAAPVVWARLVGLNAVNSLEGLKLFMMGRME